MSGCPILLHYNNAINLLTYICKIVAKRLGRPIAHGNTLLRRGNLQLMVQFHRQGHVQLPGLLAQHILLNCVRCAARPGRCRSGLWLSTMNHLLNLIADRLLPTAIMVIQDTFIQDATLLQTYNHRIVGPTVGSVL